MLSRAKWAGEVGTLDGGASLQDASVHYSGATGTDGDPLGLVSASLGAYGALLKRAGDKPITFRFSWKGIGFRALVSGRDHGLRLAIEADMAPVPYTVENPEGRKDMLAVIDATGDDRVGRICVVQGHTIVLENAFTLPDNDHNTISSIIATLTIMVIRASPYLQALSDYLKEAGYPPSEARGYQAEKQHA